MPEEVYAERYLVPGGAGAKTGLSFADAFDETQIAGDQAVLRRYNIAGTFNRSSVLTWNTAASKGNPIMFRGWKGDLSAPADDLVDQPIFDGAGLGAGVPIIDWGSYHLYAGITFQNHPYYALYNGNNDYQFTDLCVFKDGQSGHRSDNGANHSRNLYESLTIYGIDQDAWGDVTSCIFIDVATGCRWVNNYHAVTGCYFGTTGSQANIGIQGLSGLNLAANFNTFNNLTTAFTANNGDRIQITGNQFTGNLAAVASTVHAVLAYNNFYNNTSDHSAGVASIVNSFAVDPDYVDIANHDFEIQESSLIGVDLGVGNNMSMNIGAWQGGAGGGGGGGMIVHPGMAGGLRG